MNVDGLDRPETRWTKAFALGNFDEDGLVDVVSLSNGPSPAVVLGRMCLPAKEDRGDSE